MHRRQLLLLGLLAPGAAGRAAAAAEERAARIRAACEAARPTDADLGIFRLDWAESLKDAKARAAHEQRPIFFVSTTQLKDAGDLRGGHC